MARLAAALLLFAVQSAAAALQTVQPSRSFGYFIGDVLVQRINLDSDSAAALAPELTPARVGQYLYRLSSTVVRDNDQRWLELRYQIINAPATTTAASLPGITLASESGTELLIEPWPFNVSPLTVGEDTQRVLPDRSALAVLERRSGFALMLSAAALLAALLLWLAWWLWRTFRDDRTLPFAKAKQAIKRLPKAQRDADPAAWIALHRAFNSVASKTVSTGSVSQLFATAPWLEPCKDAIERFYAASAARFFQQTDAPHAVSVEALCDALYRLEKRQQPAANAAQERHAQH